MTTTLSLAQKRALLAQLLRNQGDDAIYPLSYGQHALWLLARLAPQSSAYNIHCAFRIHATIDHAAWQRALLALIRRHPILATTFPAYQSHPLSLPPQWATRTTSDAHTLAAQLFDTSHLAPENISIETHNIATWDDNAIQTFLHETSHRPFDLACEYPFRCLLLTTSAQEHILLFVVHHIIVDGRTMSLLLRDFLHLAINAPLPPPCPTSYRHFVLWQRQLLASTRGKQLRDYWLQQLAGTHLSLALPFDRPRPTGLHTKSASVALPLDALTPRLRAFAHAEQITLYTLLLTGFLLLLYRYSYQEDILISSPMAGRSHPDFEHVAGYFANLVVLRTRIIDTLTIRQLFDRMQHTVLEAIEHQDYPFALLVEQLQPERDPRLPPIANIAFAMESQALDKGNLFSLMCEDEGFQLHLGDLRLEAFSSQLPQEGTFDLTLMVFEHEQHLKASFLYNANLFEETTITRMARHFLALLHSLLTNAQQRITDLSFLSQEERHQLLITHNQTQHVLPQNTCIHQHFEQIAARMPDAIALWWEGGQLSYGELDQHANYLAHALRTQGVGPEILIGVCLPRSPHLLICLLAILKAGGAYIPLDPALPPTRLTCLIEDAHLSLILTDTHTSTCLPASRPDLRLLSLDEPSSHLIGRTTRPPQNMCLPANLAYVIYTSGTTGQPKGVAVTHHGLLNLVLNLQRQLHLQAGTRVIQCASLSFDASLLEISLALFTGGSLYLPSSPTLLGTALLHTLNEQAIELAFFTPSLLSTLPRASLPSLHTLLVGGEACPLDLMRTWSQGRRYYNLYGPTEITIFSSCAPCTPDQTCMHLGSPIANTQHYVLDANLQPVPTGVPGELYISGYGLARGYLGHPALTAQCFLPHPFAQQPGERLYRTGDRARWRTDGTIEFLGRNDQQVKLRGHRIELAEIEAILCQQPGIRACLVTLDAHAAHLIAYLLMETPAPTLHTLLPALKQLLPSYMIPSYFVPLDAFPTTIQGKIDYHALPHPTEHHLAHTASQTLPHTETERILATIWQTVLGLTEVHRDDNFFELGGHSLLITHLATEIQDRFDLLLPLSTISQHPTIAALAHVIDQQRQGTPAPQVASVNQRGARR